MDWLFNYIFSPTSYSSDCLKSIFSKSKPVLLEFGNKFIGSFSFEDKSKSLPEKLATFNGLKSFDLPFCLQKILESNIV